MNTVNNLKVQTRCKLRYFLTLFYTKYTQIGVHEFVFFTRSYEIVAWVDDQRTFTTRSTHKLLQSAIILWRTVLCWRTKIFLRTQSKPKLATRIAEKTIVPEKCQCMLMENIWPLICNRSLHRTRIELRGRNLSWYVELQYKYAYPTFRQHTISRGSINERAIEIITRSTDHLNSTHNNKSMPRGHFCVKQTSKTTHKNASVLLLLLCVAHVLHMERFIYARMRRASTYYRKNVN